MNSNLPSELHFSICSSYIETILTSLVVLTQDGGASGTQRASSPFHIRRGTDPFDFRCKYDIDLRQLPALKVLHLRNRDERYVKRFYIDFDEGSLRYCVFGKEDQE